MATVAIRDDAIWIKHIEGGRLLQERLLSMKAGDNVHLEVDGIIGSWERMRDGRDGRPTYGIKPLAQMRDVWSKLRQETGRIVQVREVTMASTYLDAVAATLTEWNSPEDEAAYADL